MSEQSPKFNIPVAILVAGLIIAGAVYFAGRSDGPAAGTDSGSADAPQAGFDPTKIQPTTAKDHIRGNFDAPIKIVAFSDLECPFCKKFHDTLTQTLAHYGDKVVWVYRHFPLTSLHSKALEEAVATECAAKLGGNEIFWQYIDKIFEITPSNNGLDLAKLPEIAEELGLDKAAFNDCLASGQFDALIESQTAEVTAAGGSGTPFTVIITPSGEKLPLVGFAPFEALKQGIDTLLAEDENETN